MNLVQEFVIATMMYVHVAIKKVIAIVALQIFHFNAYVTKSVLLEISLLLFLALVHLIEQVKILLFSHFIDALHAITLMVKDVVNGVLKFVILDTNSVTKVKYVHSVIVDMDVWRDSRYANAFKSPILDNLNLQ